MNGQTLNSLDIYPTDGSGICSHSGAGPIFGAGHDLALSNGCKSNTNSYTNKNNYGRSTSYKNFELSGPQSRGNSHFVCSDYEVYTPA